MVLAIWGTLRLDRRIWNVGSMISSHKIRVGLVGANVVRGWGTLAHVPALRGLEEFEIEAVGTSRQETADEAAREFGVRLAFGDAAELARHPDVDVVAVAVRVTEHERLVRAALSAGKHVYCEWPLGVDVAEARSLTDLAARGQVRTVVGLQGSCSAGARTVRDFLERGTLGRLTAVSVVGSGGPGGPRTPQVYAYTLDGTARTTILTISAAHWLATLERAVGRLRAVSAVLVQANDVTVIEETGERISVNAPDQVALCGVLDGGAAFSIAVHSGVAPAATGFEARIVGTEGTMLITPARPAPFHIADWHITLARRDGSTEVLALHDEDRLPASIPAGPPKHVASVYRELARAITERWDREPDFRTAVRFHELVDIIDRASKTGTQQEVPGGAIRTPGEFV